jgi:hypothetical protein
MENQEIQYIDYVSASEHNFHVSLLKLPEAVSLFTKLDQQILDMSRHLNLLPTLTEKDTFYFIGSFLLIAQRQMRNAFTLQLRRTSYDAMLLLRVGLESTVFAYRIFKEPSLLEVWARKNENRKEFTQKFSRDEIPSDMPFKEKIEQQLDRLNDYWAHPNIGYFATALQFQEEEIKVHFFDHSERTFHAVLLSSLDLCLNILAVFRKILADRFAIFITSTELTCQQLVTEFEQLKKKYRSIIEV